MGLARHIKSTPTAATRSTGLRLGMDFFCEMRRGEGGEQGGQMQVALPKLSGIKEKWVTYQKQGPPIITHPILHTSEQGLGEMRHFEK